VSAAQIIEFAAFAHQLAAAPVLELNETIFIRAMP
jgi:hypothetical protein